MRLPAALLLATLLLAPLAAAQEARLSGLVAPERTMAGRPFDLAVTIQNDGATERTVYLFAALYAKEAGKGPCGAATDARYRGLTQSAQEPIRVPAGATVAYPPRGEAWTHRYSADQVPAAPTPHELCVFLVEDDKAGTATIRYLDLATTTVSTRGVNQAPTVGFDWSPRVPMAAQDAVFTASGADADRDPLTFRWDFGHHDASGRAVAEGREVTHYFYPEGEYDVLVVASDGFDEARASERVRVVPEVATQPPAGVPTSPIPAAGALVAIVALAMAASRRRP